MLFGQEELSALKRERVNRSLLFSPATDLDTRNKDEDDTSGGVIAQANLGNMLGKVSEGVLRVSCKQVRCATVSSLVSSKGIVSFLSESKYMIVLSPVMSNKWYWNMFTYVPCILIALNCVLYA